jgi:hypothetical protein
MSDRLVYEGVCVGGPYDGVYHAHANDEFTVAIVPAAVSGPILMNDNVQIKWVRYVYTNGRWEYQGYD